MTRIQLIYIIEHSLMAISQNLQANDDNIDINKCNDSDNNT